MSFDYQRKIKRKRIVPRAPQELSYTCEVKLYFRVTSWCSKIRSLPEIVKTQTNLKPYTPKKKRSNIFGIFKYKKEMGKMVCYVITWAYHHSSWVIELKKLRENRESRVTGIWNWDGSWWRRDWHKIKKKCMVKILFLYLFSQSIYLA